MAQRHGGGGSKQEARTRISTSVYPAHARRPILVFPPSSAPAPARCPAGPCLSCGPLPRVLQVPARRVRPALCQVSHPPLIQPFIHTAKLSRPIGLLEESNGHTHQPIHANRPMLLYPSIVLYPPSTYPPNTAQAPAKYPTLHLSSHSFIQKK